MHRLNRGTLSFDSGIDRILIVSAPSTVNDDLRIPRARRAGRPSGTHYSSVA
jgi:hypothetical protein